MLAEDISFKIYSFHLHLFCIPQRKDKSIGCLNTLGVQVFVKTALSLKCYCSAHVPVHRMAN